jgi:uncharacterized FAD-dependent dehydrogenase
MLRLTELKLPLEHSADELRAAVLQRLGIAAEDLAGFSIARRGFDARWRGAIALVYHLDVAVGHSARDTFEMLLARGVQIEAKPFSIGLRIEHPQSLIDRCRFGPQAGHPLLGAGGHQRHEPVLPRREERQQRHRRGHHAGGFC